MDSILYYGNYPIALFGMDKSASCNLHYMIFSVLLASILSHSSLLGGLVENSGPQYPMRSFSTFHVFFDNVSHERERVSCVGV